MLKESQVLRKSSFIKFRCWNLNDLAAHDFVKVPSIEMFICTHNNILCLSENFLHSTIDLNDGNINITGYSILFILVTINAEVFQYTSNNLYH